MMKEKIISIIIGISVYIVVSCTLHSLLGGSHDVALGILYMYSDMLYMAGFTIAFLFYGSGNCFLTTINGGELRFLYN